SVEPVHLERAARPQRSPQLGGDARGHAVELTGRRRVPRPFVGPHEPEDEHLDPVDLAVRGGRAARVPTGRRVEDEAISLNLLPVGTSSAAAPCEDEGDRKVRFGPWGPKKGAL